MFQKWNKILTEETQSPNYNLHVSFGFINAKFLDIPLSVTTCHWCRNVKQSVTSGTRKILKICSVHLLTLFRAISPEENSNTLRNAVCTWRRAMANQMRHRGVSFIELCSGLKLKVAISCLLAYYVHMKSGDMWAVGGKAKSLQLHLQGYFQERGPRRRRISLRPWQPHHLQGRE